MATNEEMKLEYEIMGETWKFFKKYFDGVTDWETVIKESREISNKYNSQLCNDILTAYVMDLERKVMQNV